VDELKDGEHKIVYGMPYEEYAAYPAVNGSLLAMVHSESLRTVRAYLDGKRKWESDEMDFGSAFHALLLEGKEEFTEQPETYPAPAKHAKVKKGEVKEGDPLPWNANAGVCEQWLLDNPGTVLTKSEVVQVRGMVDAVRAEEELTKLLSGKSEVSVFVRKAEEHFKIRVDLLPDDPKAPVIDFKKTKSAKPEKFVRQIFDLSYCLKAAFYLKVLRMAGIDRKEFWFVGIEKDYPHDTYVSKLRPTGLGMLEYGSSISKKAYLKLMAAYKRNYWPSHGAGDAEDHITPFMMSKIESEL
jgi:hypothetical protein